MVQRKTSVAAGLKAVLAVGAWLALAGALGGCGQKGPLMLPAPSGSASAPAR
jgi:predicted small lipoprotein YifL